VTTEARPALAARSRRLDLVAVVGLFVALMFLYEAIRDFVGPADGAAAPFDHAADVIALERHLGLFVEDDLQRLAQRVGVIDFATTWFYTVGYTAGFVCFFAWLWWRHREKLPFLFAWYWITNGLALLGYWLYPLAPPRLVPALGLVDPTQESLKLGGAMSWFEPFRNLYAAMPSMHVGQTVIYAVAITAILRSPARFLVWLWPAMMTFTVMATANHYWLDGLGGTVAAGLGLGIALLVFPRLERPWSRRPAPARAGAREVAVT
jgi:PAP2 superfamily